jgi:hypothetical protein
MIDLILINRLNALGPQQIKSLILLYSKTV